MRLAEIGNESGPLLASAVFGVVFVTVAAHGLSLGWLGRKLGLAADHARGIIIVGITPWSLPFANTLYKNGINVLLVDREHPHIQLPRQSSLKTYIGDILSEYHLRNVDVVNYQNVVACTNNDSYNALVCTMFADIYGRQNTFQLAPVSESVKDDHKWQPALKGRVLSNEEIGYEELLRRHFQNWEFKLVTIQDETTMKQPDNASPIKFLRLRDNQEVAFFTQDYEPTVKSGDKILIYQ